MTLAIVGSRNYSDWRQVIDFVNGLPADTIVISGGARGVDQVAVKAAQQRNLSTVVIPAEWDKHGRAAGFLRNHDIVAQADQVVAFWDGKSKGTEHTIAIARKVGKLQQVFRDDLSLRTPTP